MVMKKIIMAIVAFAAVTIAALADNDKAVPYEKLPAKAKYFINLNFSDGRLAYSKQERDFMEVHYEVVLVAGVKIVFDRGGEWVDIECRYSGLDEKFIPEPVRSRVAELYPDAEYKKISKNRGNYEVKLANGAELTFDKKFSIVEVE